MSNIQFDFNPLTPSPGEGGNFQWGYIVIGLGLFAIVIAFIWHLTKDTVADELLTSDSDQENQL